MVQTYRFLPTNAGAKTKKKGLRREILGFVLAFTCVYRSGTSSVLTLGVDAQTVFWGAQAPKCTPVAPGLQLVWGTQSSLGGRISRWGGTSSDLGEQAPKCPPWCRAWSWANFYSRSN